RDLADYFEAVAENANDPKTASNWVMGEVLRALKENQSEVSQFAVKPAALASLIALTKKGEISGKIAKQVFSEMVNSGKCAEEIVKEKGLTQVSDAGEIEKQVRTVLDDHPAEVEKYLSGKEQVIGFLVGQVMRATRGQANPKVVNEILRKELQKRKK
ncbi:MAG: Asp-tRNA(Asn)/Glu-tRNA(Gln) amidotransferase GatCAB subunit B, partial [bacterium]